MDILREPLIPCRSIYSPKTAATPKATTPYPTTLAPAPLAVCSGAADPVAEFEPLAVRVPLVAVEAAEPDRVAEPEPEEGRVVGTFEIVTPTAAQRVDTAGARPVFPSENLGCKNVREILGA
jgi:hypothetical protein